MNITSNCLVPSVEIRNNSVLRSQILKARIDVAVMSFILAIATVAFCVAPTRAANYGAPRIAPPGSHAFETTYQERFTDYWRWFFGTAQDPAQSAVGQVTFIPQPVGEPISGSGTPEDPVVLVGELAITLRPGTSFVLPLLGIVGERYEGYPGIPDDDPANFTSTMSANLTIDGRTVVSDANADAFFVPVTFFNPIVVYPEPTFYGSVAAIWFDGIGIVSPPLPVGVHVIHLDATNIVPGVFGVTYDNTWTITVTPH
jgi:hypothetical protein